jgi:hypothetical protein
MENLGSLKEIKEKIAQGDVEAAQAFITNPGAYSDEPVYDDSIPAEEDLETIQPQQEEVEEVEESAAEDAAEETTETPIPEEDPLTVERKRVDALEKEYEAKEAEILASAKFREEGLLKQVEEARNKKTEDETFFFGEEEQNTSEGVETPKQAEVADTTDADWEERFTRLEERQKAKEIEDASIREFTSFWQTEKGKELKPEGMDADKTIKVLDGFYDTLMGHYKNDEKAVLRTLHDLRNPETSEAYAERLKKGDIEIPEQFDKIYDNWNVRMFSHGIKLDPVLGSIVPFREGKLNSLEDAHFLMNKDKLLFEAKMETFDQINSKMRQHREAATTIDPSQTASFADSGQLMDAGYRTALLTQMREAGVKPGSKDLSMITDPDLRRQAEQLMKFM